MKKSKSEETGYAGERGSVFGMTMKAAGSALAVLLCTASAVWAAGPASDNASDPVYADAGGGNFAGLNGGAGFGEWQVSPDANTDTAGAFIGDSNGNGSGNGPGINSDGDVAFGLFANSGDQVEAIRPLGSVLEDGQVIAIDVDVGSLGGNALQAVGLLDGDGLIRFELVARAGSGTYIINDSETEIDTGISLAEGGIRVMVTITSADTYDLSISDLAEGFEEVFSGRTFGGASGTRIAYIRAVNYNDEEGGAASDLFVNNPLVDCAGFPACVINQIEGSSPSCAEQVLVFSGPEGADSYFWAIDNNTSGAYIDGMDNEQNVVVVSGSDAGSFDLMLEVVAGECAVACGTTVEVGALPAPEAGNNSPICEGQDLVLTATPIDGATYTWVGPDLFLSTEQNPVIISASLAAEGEYSVSASVNGCPSEVASTFVTILPAPSCLIDGDENICPGTEQVIYYAPNDLIAYNWTLEGDATLENSTDGGFVRITPAAEGSFTLTLTIEDVNGCTVTCVKNVVIGDVTGPEMECPDNAFVNPGDDLTPDALGYPSVLDNCDPNPVVSFEDAEAPGECVGSTVITRTWTAEDVYGNVSTCEQTITVQDNQAPDLVVPEDAYLGCGADTSVEALGDATATDNLDPAPVVSYTEEIENLGCDNYYIIQRIWTAVDSCGNVAEVTQSITVEDATAPEMVLPADVAIALDADNSPDALGFATATDACEGEVAIEYFDDVVAGACESQYTINRYWTAIDPCGNSAEGVQVITVGGGEVTLAAPDDAVVGCDADNSPDSTGYATATDALGNSVETAFEDAIVPADCGGRYIILRTWMAEDSCGNVAEVVQSIVVDDLVAPVVTVPEDVNVVCGSDVSAELLGEATAVDNCDGAPTISFEDVITSGACGSSYTIARVWRAVDQCGNIGEATQTITVSDDVAPELSIPADAQVACGADVSTDALGSATAADNCETEIEVSYADAIEAGLCAGSYTIRRTWRAEDPCGNASEAVQVITVSDDASPTLVVPADVAVSCGGSTAPASTGSATATDDCGSATVSYADVVSGSTILRTWTAVDDCGNTASAVQTITTSGAGNGPPVITSPGDQIITVGCGQAANFQIPTATGGCGGESVSVVCSPASGSVLSPGVNVITATATDGAGNSSTITFKVTVLSPLRVVFQNPLKDDNKANNIETDKDVENNFKSGANVPHKIRLYDCNDKDVTAAVSGLVNVNLDVTLRMYTSSSHSIQLLDLWEVYSGTGAANGKMVYTGGQFQYNLKTLLYPPNTDCMPWFIRSLVTVEYKSAPGVVVGREDALLESKLK